MSLKISKRISQNFQNCKIKKIQSGASKKIFYRLRNNSKSYIITDFNNDKKEYQNYIKIYNLLKEINVSIPQIIENYDNNLLLISEDFGNLRFDKILKDYSLKDILNYAVETLVILNNSIKFNYSYAIFQYDFKTFESEIMELPKYYFPYIELNDTNLIEEFFYIWYEAFRNIEFEFNSFLHKDFNFNNLILLPSQKNHLKCGIIDFQSAFWGESSWDLFSLLEDSRILFSDDYNEYFIKYFYSRTINNISFEEFINRYYFLSTSRQTRLLGRWVKLAKELNQNWYLEFISITLYRLKKSINLCGNKNLIKFYNKYIFK